VKVNSPTATATFGGFVGLRWSGWKNVGVSTDPIAESCVLLSCKAMDFNYRIEGNLFSRCFGGAIKTDPAVALSVVNFYIERCRWDSIGGFCFEWTKPSGSMEARPFVIRDWTYDNNIASGFDAAAIAQGYYNATAAEWGYGLVGIGTTDGTNSGGFFLRIQNGRFESNKRVRTYDNGRALVYLNNTGLTSAAFVHFEDVVGFANQADAFYMLRVPSGSCHYSLDESDISFMAGVMETPNMVRGRSSNFIGSGPSRRIAGDNFLFAGGTMIGGKLFESHSLAPGGTATDLSVYRQGDVWLMMEPQDTGPSGYVNGTAGLSYNGTINLTTNAVVTAGSPVVALGTINDMRTMAMLGLNVVLTGAGPAGADLTTTITGYSASASTITVADVPSTSVNPCTIKSVPATWYKTFVAFRTGTTAWNPPSIASGAQTSLTPPITVTGAALGDFVELSANASLQGLRMWGEITVANTLTVFLSNLTGAAVDLGNFTIAYRVSKP
jgi:hypothetical protein